METCIAAATLGAEILEFHAVFSRKSFGPDATSSLEINEIKEVVQAARNISEAINYPLDKSDNSRFKDLKKIFEKSLAVNKDLESGHELTFEDLEAKKPKGFGIDASKFQEVIGKRLKNNLLKWDFLNQNDIENGK